MFTDEYEDGSIVVRYISAHTGHEFGSQELKCLPLPASTKEEVVLKVSTCIPSDRILQGKGEYKKQITISEP